MKTAVLIFCNTPHKEVSEKAFQEVFDQKQDKALHLARALLENTRRIARESGLDVVEISSDHQIGDTFGARYSHAFSTVFALGYEKVISIGSDCPTLSVEDLEEAALSLEQYKGVIGMAKDGGAFLIGLTYEAFYPEQWAKLNWKSSQTLEALKSYFQEYSPKVYLLEHSRRDVDRPADLEKILVELSEKAPFYRFLRFLLFKKPNFFISKPVGIFQILIRSQALRAPPFL